MTITIEVAVIIVMLIMIIVILRMMIVMAAIVILHSYIEENDNRVMLIIQVRCLSEALKKISSTLRDEYMIMILTATGGILIITIIRTITKLMMVTNVEPNITVAIVIMGAAMITMISNYHVLTCIAVMHTTINRSMS